MSANGELKSGDLYLDEVGDVRLVLTNNGVAFHSYIGKNGGCCHLGIDQASTLHSRWNGYSYKYIGNLAEIMKSSGVFDESIS